MSTVTSLITSVLQLGGGLALIGTRIEVYLPDTPEGDALIEKLRSVRDEILYMLMQPRQEDFQRWALDRCVYRNRCFGEIGALCGDFGEWAIAHDSVPCTRSTFEALLRAAGFLFADGLVSGLMLKGTYVTKRRASRQSHANLSGASAQLGNQGMSGLEKRQTASNRQSILTGAKAVSVQTG